jgi:hypothetical protein
LFEFMPKVSLGEFILSESLETHLIFLTVAPKYYNFEIIPIVTLFTLSLVLVSWNVHIPVFSFI